MEMLEQLRNAHFERHAKKAQRIKIQEQFDKITKLRQEKEMLDYKLKSLREGCCPTDLYPRYAQDNPRFIDLHNKFLSLKQKLSAYRLLGPCGLTVLDVDCKFLVVSFMAMWKDKKQSFILHLADDVRDGKVMVRGTDIPHFINIESMLSAEVVDYSKVMEEIGYQLNAYTQRLKEVEIIQKNYKAKLRKLDYNDSLTCIGISLYLPDVEESASADAEKRSGLELKIRIVYNCVSSIVPHRIGFRGSVYFSKLDRTTMSSILKSKPLSETFPELIELLEKIATGSQGLPNDHDDEANDESAG